MKSFVVLLLASLAWANVSLVIPDFEPQPLSAEIVGVGANNMTTYLLVPGEATGTFSTQAPAFTGTATLIENSNSVVFEYADSAVTVIESCAYASGIADCEVVLGGGTTGSAVDTVTPLLVQGGGTASSVVSSLSVLATSSVTATSTASVSSTQSATGAGPTQTSGGVRGMAGGLSVAVGLAVGLLLA